MSGKKILVITSSEDTLQLQSGKKVKTGMFLNEMMVPLLKLREKGYTFTLANPKGLVPALDPLGDRTLWFGFSTSDYLAARNLFDTLKQSVRALSSLEEAELQSYAGVFIPGGHAPLVDLSSNRDVGRILFLPRSKEANRFATTAAVTTNAFFCWVHPSEGIYFALKGGKKV